MTRPSISELKELLRNLNENHDALKIINREVQDTVEIDELEAEVEDAFEFDALVCMAKAKAEFEMVQVQRARQNLIASYKGRIDAELHENRQDMEKDRKNTHTSDTDQNASAVNDKGQVTTKTNAHFEGVTLLDTDHLVSNPEETKSDEVITHKKVSDRRALMPTTFRPVHANEIINDSTTDNLTSPVIPKSTPSLGELNDGENCKRRERKGRPRDSLVEDGKRSLLRRHPLCPPVLTCMLQRKNQCKRSKEKTARRKRPKTKDLEAGLKRNSPPLRENRRPNRKVAEGKHIRGRRPFSAKWRTGRREPRHRAELAYRITARIISWKVKFNSNMSLVHPAAINKNGVNREHQVIPATTTGKRGSTGLLTRLHQVAAVAWFMDPPTPRHRYHRWKWKAQGFELFWPTRT